MPTTNIYEPLRSKILQKLENHLSKDLFYHSVHHTIDVETQAERIALNENITNHQDLLLLKVASLYHDSGFLFTYIEHEKASCKLVKEELPFFGFAEKEIDIICGLIMATRIPQTPLNRLEEIICDADLDYLGREDFFSISNNLFLELKARKIIATKKDWDLVQVKFFKVHHFFTNSNKKLRGQQKQRHLEMIEAML